MIDKFICLLIYLCGKPVNLMAKNIFYRINDLGIDHISLPNVSKIELIIKLYLY